MNNKLTHCMCGCIYEEPECPRCNKITDKDRIEELEAKLGRYNDLVADKINLRSENADLKAKLAKAIERFTEISGRPNEMIWAHDSEVREAMRDMEQIADTTIAELTGGKDDNS